MFEMDYAWHLEPQTDKSISLTEECTDFCLFC